MNSEWSTQIFASVLHPIAAHSPIAFFDGSVGRCALVENLSDRVLDGFFPKFLVGGS